MPQPPSLPLPLAGLRVLDLSMFMSGPLATLFFADAGAEIIKVESLQRLDGWRGASAPAPGIDAPWEMAPSFNWINRNKRDITLNLTDPRGQDLCKRLAAISDIVIENYTPRVMGQFGLAYDTLRAVKPDLIMLSMPGFGLTGSFRDYTAFAWTTEQMSGITDVTGYPGGQPLFTGSTLGDPLAGLMGGIALLAALQHRAATGEGQHIDLSQTEASTMFIGDAFMDVALNGRDPGRRGNRHPAMAPHGIYPCRDDRWIAIACRDGDEWRALARAMRRDAWLAPDSPLATLAGRQAAHDDLDAAIAGWTRAQDFIACMHHLQAEGVAAGAVMNGADILHDAHLAARRSFIPQDRPGLGVKHYPRQPYRFAATPEVAHVRAPMLGEHNREILGGLLGLSDAELAALERNDVIGTLPIAARPA